MVFASSQGEHARGHFIDLERRVEKCRRHATGGERINLIRANMRTANLSGAMLRGGDFFQADLAEADLSRADLKDSRLSAAKLFNTNQTDTKFAGAIMPDNSVHP